jgi:hypothetical protein
VLVVRSHDTVADTSSPWDLGIGINWLSGEDAGGASLEGDLARLVKDPSKDVLVVGNGDDLLQNKLPLAHHRGVLGAVVGVLPLDALVYFVDADGVGLLDSSTVISNNMTAKVLDNS